MDPLTPDPTVDTDAAQAAQKRRRRWIAISAVAVVGAGVTIVVLVSAGDDNGNGSSATTAANAGSVGKSASPNGSAGSTESATANGGSSGGAAPGLQPTTVAGSGTNAPGGSVAATQPVATVPGAAGATSTTVAPGAQPPTTQRVDLGAAADFAVLANTGVASSGPTTISGQVGASNGSSTGFSAAENPSGIIVTGALSAAQGQLAADSAASELDAIASTPLAAAELAGQTIGPGTYGSAALTLTGTVTLDAGGDPNALFVIESTDTLTTSSASRVVLAGGAQPCNVFWRVGSSATLGADSRFAGTVMAEGSIKASTGAQLDGRLIARNGAVSLDTDAINTPTCT